jgi:hypothetical protein
VVLDMLAAREDPRFFSAYLPAAVRARAHVTEAEVWEMLWQLVAEGLIYLDPSGQHSGTDNWRWKLSRRGEVAAAGGVIDPYDPDGYLARLRQQVPNIDPIVELYADEALRAFVAQCYLASSVMLGVASEQAFLGMAEAFCASLDGSEGENLHKLLDSAKTTYSAKLKEVRKRLEPRRNQLPDSLSESLVLDLDAVADLLRVTRNETGHPTGRVVDENTAYTHLQLFARYALKLARLADHFRAHARPAPGPGDPTNSSP